MHWPSPGGAALKGAYDAWASVVLEATGTENSPPVGVNLFGQPLAGYDDFTHSINRTVLCENIAEASGGRTFSCQVAGEPCLEVPNCDDPAVIALGCIADDTL